MAKYFLLIRVVSRSKGSRVTRAAAYRAGERIRDERTNGVFDFTGRQDIAHKEIVLPSLFAGRTDMNWARDRSILWNAAERAGRRNDARLAQEIIVFLPLELSPSRRAGLALTFARQLADRYQNAVDLAVHQPRRGSDERHHHAHFLMTTREVTTAGLGRRTGLQVAGPERLPRGLGPWNHEFPWIRERWAQLTNEALRDAGLTARVDHRSYKHQGMDREPVPTLPQKVYYLERKSGVAHPIGEVIRARYRERIEARLQGPDALARVVQRQRENRQRQAIDYSKQKTGVPRTIRPGMLTRDELNRIRRERYRANASELTRKARERLNANPESINRRRRELYRSNAVEINRKRREWYRVYRKTHAAEMNRSKREYRKAHAEELNRKQRERRSQARARKEAEARNLAREAATGFRAERSPPMSDVSVLNTPAVHGSKDRSPISAEAARSGPTASGSQRDPSPTTAGSARRWLKSRELGQQPPTTEESARRWLEFRDSGEHSPTAEESARRWLELRQGKSSQAATPEDLSERDPGEHNSSGKDTEDDEESSGPRRDRSRDDGQGL